MKTFDTVAKLKLAKLKEGQFVETGGRSASGDGKRETYFIAPSQSVDEITDFTLANGNVALQSCAISVQTSTGTNESASSIVIGDMAQAPKDVGEGSVLIGGYHETNRNRLIGTTELRAIIAGYDCEITERGASDDGGLACVIVGSHHSEIQGDATHALIAGGSLNTITDGDYNLILGGTANTLTNTSGRPSTSYIIGGNTNNIDGGNGLIIGGRNNTVTGEYSLVVMGQDSKAEGNFTTVLGAKNEARKGTLGNGQKNTISGGRFNIIDGITSPNGNTIGGGESNEAYGVNNTISGGTRCITGTALANATYGVIGGGLDNLNSAETAGTVSGGRDNNATADYSIIQGGRNNKTTATYSIALGYEAESRLSGFEALANGAISARGDNQALRGVKSTTTTDASAGLTGSLVMEDESTWRFECVVVAHEVGGSDAASFKITGLAQRGTGVGTVSLIGVPTVVGEFSTAGASSWSAAVITNTASGAIRAQVTGAAATTINWCTRWDLLECIS